MFSARRQRMSSLKICFLFFPSFFLFLWLMQEIKFMCISLYAFLSTTKRRWTPSLGIKWF
jgi:hypothetical protein